jgi:hypothetical protein
MVARGTAVTIGVAGRVVGAWLLDADPVLPTAHPAVAVVILTTTIDARAGSADAVLATVPARATVVVGVAAGAVLLGPRATRPVGAADAVVADVAFARAVLGCTDTLPVLAGVVLRTRVAIVTGGAILLAGSGALSGLGITLPRLVALIRRGADDGGIGDALATLAGSAAAAAVPLTRTLTVLLADQAIATRIADLGRVRFTLSGFRVADFAHRAGGFAGAGAAVNALLAVVLDRAALAAASLGC